MAQPLAISSTVDKGQVYFDFVEAFFTSFSTALVNDYDLHSYTRGPGTLTGSHLNKDSLPT